MFKISLDAGHGGFGVTPGKRIPDGSMYEWDFNGKVISYMQQELAFYENVAVLRVDDPTGKTDVPLKMRTDRVNGWGSNVHVSVHANAAGDGWSTAHGIETFVYKLSGEQYALAQKVQADLIAATGLTNRGVKAQDLHMLRETKMTAILCECGFMTNQSEAQLLKSDDYRKIVALAIVNGLSEQYGLKKKVLAQPAQKMEVVYMLEKAIVVNGFADFATAEPLANRLEAPIYTRAALGNRKVSKELYVVGGTIDGLQADKIIPLTGADRYEVAAAVKRFLG